MIILEPEILINLPMKRLLTICVLLIVAASLSAQKADFRAAEKFSPENLRPTVGDLSVSPQWIHDFDIFWYSFKNPNGKNYYYVDAAKRSKRLLFDSKYMASQMQLLVKKNYNHNDLPLRDIKFEEKSSTKFTFVADSIKFLYDITSSKLTISDTIKRTRPERRPGWLSYSPDSTWITFGRGYDLYLMKAGDKDSVEIRLTTDGEAYYSYTAASSTSTPDTTKKVAARVSWFRNSEKF